MRKLLTTSSLELDVITLDTLNCMAVVDLHDLVWNFLMKFDNIFT